LLRISSLLSHASHRQQGRETYAYSLEEIQELLKALSEPARTIVAVAAFTGLSKSELRGLRWEDLAKDETNGDEIRVTRTVWGKHVGEPKTRSRRAPVPLLPFLVRVLEAHRERSIAKGEYIFSTATGRPPDLDNLRFRVIRKELRLAKAKVKWYGWHAFRRGLASNLYRLGITDKTIQPILRHANVTTTQACYIKTAPADAHLAMQRLEKVLGAGWPTSAHGKAC
jgi:integrase